MFLNFSFYNLYSQDADKTITITVSGSGKSQEEAKQSALRSAIEQAFGAFISSKTEILNDKVVADQIVSVSNGNIQSYSVLNESQLPDSTWGVTLKASVSVSKLTNFAESKGVSIEFKGGMFALNIKQQLLNEQGEIKAVAEMIGLLHEPMQISFDYVIKSSDPQSLDAESKNWEIPLLVTATCNKNIDFCANYFKKTLAALSLSQSEVETYKSLNKQIFPVNIDFQNQFVTYYLRKQSSISAIHSFISHWETYTRLFAVQNGMDETFGNVYGSQFAFSGSSTRRYYLSGNSIVNINFPTNGQQVATFRWNEERTLAQIEQMTDYYVKPRGVVSNFKNGGYVVYEKNGHGLVMALMDVGNFNWKDAKTACNELILNGYNDWRLPLEQELEYIFNNLYKINFKCGISLETNYLSGSWINDSLVWCFDFRNKNAFQSDKYTTWQVRAVRTF